MDDHHSATSQNFNFKIINFKKKTLGHMLTFCLGGGVRKLHKPISQVTTSPFYFIGEK